MAVSRKKKPGKKYKFELTRGGIGGIGVVCFCLFLWMFLFGVWTGQSLLMPSSVDSLEESDDYQEILIFDGQRKKLPEK